MHDIDVTYYLCNVDGCEYKAKQQRFLTEHKFAIHDIDVSHYLCKCCSYESRKKNPRGIVRSIEANDDSKM